MITYREIKLASDWWPWITFFFANVETIGSKSDCVKRQLGSVIVKDKRIISSGYNGAPAGALNCDQGGCLRCNVVGLQSGLDLEKCICVHAEMNAFLQAAKYGPPIEGASLFTRCCPCMDCTKATIQCGIRTVYYLTLYPAPGAINLLNDCGVSVIEINLIQQKSFTVTEEILPS